MILDLSITVSFDMPDIIYSTCLWRHINLGWPWLTSSNVYTYVQRNQTCIGVRIGYDDILSNTSWNTYVLSQSNDNQHWNNHSKYNKWADREKLPILGCTIVNVTSVFTLNRRTKSSKYSSILCSNITWIVCKEAYCWCHSIIRH